MSTNGRCPATAHIAGPATGSVTTEPNTSSDMQDPISRNAAMPIGVTGRVNPCARLTQR